MSSKEVQVLEMLSVAQEPRCDRMGWWCWNLLVQAMRSVIVKVNDYGVVSD